MSTAPNQPENLQSDAKPADPSPDQPEEEEEEGECGFCLFMKGGGCKDTFVDWENCVKEAEDKKEDLVEKCSQVTARLKQCMDSHSDYYAPILIAEKHAEEQAVIEFEKEKQDSAPSQSNQNDRELDSKATSTPPKQAEKEQSNVETANLSPDQPASEPPKAENREEEEEEGECGFCVFMKGGGCRDTFVDWENCVKEAEENKEDLVEKCSQVTDLLKQCMDSHSDYYAPILVAEKHIEEQAVIELEKEKLDSATSNNEQETPSHSNQK
ncbi:uncharacterized protein LOC123911232 [Trifolium pratense]|uniref:Uncharacterized protein n=1 Tax=Trifolium pratense TaxID=57577 RepID=A0ACB0K3R4_TRIPR|nr:uncharacterized protein LOC123911232 [Trifolium pratense]CAJ2650425.1 unnamed protein product [Trifolium pratense]